MAAKAQPYLAAGTRLVWVVWPTRPGSPLGSDVWPAGDTQAAVTLSLNDALDGEDALPGLTCPVSEIFASHGNDALGYSCTVISSTTSTTPGTRAATSAARSVSSRPGTVPRR